MEWVEHSVTSTHRLIAVLVVNINSVEYYVTKITGYLTKNSNVNNALLRNAISYTILTGIYYDIPNKANFSLLQTYALDNYNIGLDITGSDLTDVDSALENVVSIVKNLSYGIIHKKEYTLAQHADWSINKICIVSNLDLLSRYTIEFKFYLKRGEE